MRALARVLLPEPLGPMRACTSPRLMDRATPLRISLPSTLTCRSSMTNRGSCPFCLVISSPELLSCQTCHHGPPATPVADRPSRHGPLAAAPLGHYLLYQVLAIGVAFHNPPHLLHR